MRLLSTTLYSILSTASIVVRQCLTLTASSASMVRWSWNNSSPRRGAVQARNIHGSVKTFAHLLSHYTNKLTPKHKDSTLDR